MADQAETMRAWILRDSLNSDAPPSWAAMPFEAQRPTDTSVLTQDFFAAAKAYHVAHQQVRNQPTTANFNALVARCVACHQSHCPGPLKRINRLMIDS
jgi:cytochrome c553